MPAPAIAKTELPLVEAFSSFQGEGPWIGARQIFLRFSGCNLDCRYCDTEFQPSGTCRIEEVPGSDHLTLKDSPLFFGDLLPILRRWLQIPHHSLSLTGGEPLLHANLLAECLKELRALLPLYLESNGTLPDALAALLPHLDYISLDLKLPSTSGESPQWEAHAEFLRLARRKQAYAKVVFDAESGEDELLMAASLLAREGGGMPLILQPMTRRDGQCVAVPELFKIFDKMSSIYRNIRLIPQAHQTLGLL